MGINIRFTGDMYQVYEITDNDDDDDDDKPHIAILLSMLKRLYQILFRFIKVVHKALFMATSATWWP